METSEDLLVLIRNREQAINLIDEHINALDQHLSEFPGPYDPLNGAVYIKWERNAFSWIGQISGLLKAFKLMGVIPQEVYSAMKVRAQGKIQALMTRAIVGSR